MALPSSQMARGTAAPARLPSRTERCSVRSQCLRSSYPCPPRVCSRVPHRNAESHAQTEVVLLVDNFQDRTTTDPPSTHDCLLWDIQANRGSRRSSCQKVRGEQ